MTYEIMKNYDMWDCPFCEKTTISVTHYPKSVSVKRSKTASLPGSKGYHVNRDVYVISSGCSNCHKSSNEVEDELKRTGMI
jgi:hypothetical protein